MAVPCTESPHPWRHHQEGRTLRIKGFIEPEHETHIKTSSTTNLDQNLLSGQDIPFQGSPLISKYKHIPKCSVNMVLKNYWTACQGPEDRPSCHPR